METACNHGLVFPANPREAPFMIVERIPAIGELSPQDRYLLATELWEQIETNEDAIPVDDAVIQLLEARHQEYLADPTKVISWDALKAKLGKS
jgi:putative addiction module component (TIGR02574 family)